MLYILFFMFFELLSKTTKIKNFINDDFSVKASAHLILLVFILASPYVIFLLGYVAVSISVLCLFFLAIVLFLFATIVIGKTNYWRIKIYLRRVAFLSYYSSVLISIVIATIVVGGRLITHGYDSFTDLQYAICFTWAKVASVILIIFIGCIIETLSNEYSGKYFVLFLRSFTYDKNRQDVELLGVIQKTYSKYTRAMVMRIGDPNTILSSRSNIDTYYLPVTDWKGELSKLIRRSKYVVIVLDTSEGVMWEVFNNLEYSDKYIYYIHDINKLSDILGSDKCHEYQETFIVKFMNSLLCSNDEYMNQCAFMYNDGRVCYSDRIELIIQAQQGEKNMSIKSIEV